MLSGQERAILNPKLLMLLSETMLEQNLIMIQSKKSNSL